MNKIEMVATILYFVPGLHNWLIGNRCDFERHPLHTGVPDFDKYGNITYETVWVVTNWYGQNRTEKDKDNGLHVRFDLIEIEPEIQFKVLEQRSDREGNCVYKIFDLSLFGLLDYLESEEIKDIRNRFWGRSRYEDTKWVVEEQSNANQLVKWVKEDRVTIPKQFYSKFNSFGKEYIESEHAFKSEEETLQEGYLSREDYAKEQANLVKEYKEYLKSIDETK